MWTCLLIRIRFLTKTLKLNSIGTHNKTNALQRSFMSRIKYIFTMIFSCPHKQPKFFSVCQNDRCGLGDYQIWGPTNDFCLQK